MQEAQGHNINDINTHKLKGKRTKAFYSKNRAKLNKNLNTGHWSHAEHNLFLDSIIINGNNWKQVEKDLKTRNAIQARSHFQKLIVNIQNKAISELDYWKSEIELKIINICIQEFLNSPERLEIFQKSNKNNFISLLTNSFIIFIDKIKIQKGLSKNKEEEESNVLDKNYPKFSVRRVNLLKCFLKYFNDVCDYCRVVQSEGNCLIKIQKDKDCVPSKIIINQYNINVINNNNKFLINNENKQINNVTLHDTQNCNDNNYKV
jgi:hypothetical protein